MEMRPRNYRKRGQATKHVFPRGRGLTCLLQLPSARRPLARPSDGRALKPLSLNLPGTPEDAPSAFRKMRPDNIKHLASPAPRGPHTAAFDLCPFGPLIPGPSSDAESVVRENSCWPG